MYKSVISIICTHNKFKNGKRYKEHFLIRMYMIVCSAHKYVYGWVYFTFITLCREYTHEENRNKNMKYWESTHIYMDLLVQFIIYAWNLQGRQFCVLYMSLIRPAVRSTCKSAAVFGCDFGQTADILIKDRERNNASQTRSVAFTHIFSKGFRHIFTGDIFIYFHVPSKCMHIRTVLEY